MTEEFNPERARAAAIEALKSAGWTLAANADSLLPLIVSELGAPSEEHAKRAISLAFKILLLLEAKIEAAPLEAVGDAQEKIDTVLRKNTH